MLQANPRDAGFDRDSKVPSHPLAQACSTGYSSGISFQNRGLPGAMMGAVLTSTSRRLGLAAAVLFSAVALFLIAANVLPNSVLAFYSETSRLVSAALPLQSCPAKNRWYTMWCLVEAYLPCRSPSRLICIFLQASSIVMNAWTGFESTGTRNT